MPKIYLSPSTQEFNPYIIGGNEEQYMNLIADEMEPYLIESGISFTRNTPQMTAGSSIQASNSDNYDLHVSLHSNASPADIAGSRSGAEVYYYPGSTRGKRAADLMVERLKTIYPNPEKVRALPTTTIGEVGKTRAPAILIEYAYHDNTDDANWIKDNIALIAKTTVQGIDDYFDINTV